MQAFIQSQLLQKKLPTQQQPTKRKNTQAYVTASNCTSLQDAPKNTLPGSERDAHIINHHIE